MEIENKEQIYKSMFFRQFIVATELHKSGKIDKETIALLKHFSDAPPRIHDIWESFILEDLEAGNKERARGCTKALYHWNDEDIMNAMVHRLVTSENLFKISSNFVKLN